MSDDTFGNQTLGPFQLFLESAQLAVPKDHEVETLFGSLARILDKHCSSHARAILSEPQDQAFRNFTSELATTAAKHLNTYMYGTLTIEKLSLVKTAKAKASQN